MAIITCPVCESEISNEDWSCPHCGNPVETAVRTSPEQEISGKGMILLLALFVVVPVLLFLVHIFVPGM